MKGRVQEGKEGTEKLKWPGGNAALKKSTTDGTAGKKKRMKA